MEQALVALKPLMVVSKQPFGKSVTFFRKNFRITALWDGHDPADRDYFMGKSVEEDMVVLRKRIHDMRVVEKKLEVSSNWMTWEKNYYLDRYSSDVSEAVGRLQTILMNTRPSVAIAVSALVILWSVTSGLTLAYKLIDITRWVLASILA